MGLNIEDYLIKLLTNIKRWENNLGGLMLWWE
jgi:hypothetical protein